MGAVSLLLTSPGAGSGALQPWGECKGAKPWACLAAYGLIRCLFAVQRARAEDHPLENGMSKHHRQVVKDSEGMSRASHAISRACARRWSGTIGEDRADARLAVQTGTIIATIRRVTKGRGPDGPVTPSTGVGEAATPARVSNPSVCTATDRRFGLYSFAMMRTGRMTPIVAGLLALVLGVPGFVQACPACASMMAPTGPDCHKRSGAEFHPACCGGSSATAGCCGEMSVPETGIEAVGAKVAPAPPPLTLDPIAIASMHEALVRPVRLADDPLLYEGAGLYTLLSVLLI